jgi:hypothetical protein
MIRGSGASRRGSDSWTKRSGPGRSKRVQFDVAVALEQVAIIADGTCLVASFPDWKGVTRKVSGTISGNQRATKNKKVSRTK